MNAKLYWNKTTRSWTAKWHDAHRDKWRMKRIPCSITHEDDASDWFAAWAKSESAHQSPPPPKPVPMTIDALMKRWVAYLRALPNVDPDRHKSADAARRNWVVPYRFGSIDSAELKLSDCVDWIEDVQRDVRAHNTLRNVVQQVRSMLSDARGKGWRDKENFFLDPYVKGRLRRAYGSVPKPPVVHLLQADVLKVVAYDGIAVPFRRHTRNVFAMLTGLRAGEVQGLRWSDIHLSDPVPHVRCEQQLVVRRSTPGVPFFKPPKKNSKRTVPLHPFLVALLRRWFEKGWQEHAGRTPSPEDPVFSGAAGEWVNDARPGDLRMDLAAYGINPMFEGEKPITFHALRRTFLTLLTDAGVSDGDVKALAGHAAPGVTRAHYVAATVTRLQGAILSLPIGSSTSEAAA